MARWPKLLNDQPPQDIDWKPAGDKVVQQSIDHQVNAIIRLMERNEQLEGDAAELMREVEHVKREIAERKLAIIDRMREIGLLFDGSDNDLARVAGRRQTIKDEPTGG